VILRTRATLTGRPAHRGFSLVELMVVLIIIGLIVTVSMISWQALLPNQQFNTGIRNLSERLHDTRSKAIAFNRAFEVHYDIDEDVYYVRTPYSIDGGFAVSDEDIRRDIHYTNLVESGIDLQTITIDDKEYTDGKVYVRFDPLGASAYHTIRLEQVQFEREFTLEVLPLTGEIRFHEQGFIRREPADDNDFQ